jgi:hydroxymethylglutaryl-CoA reductase (NADPH)
MVAGRTPEALRERLEGSGSPPAQPFPAGKRCGPERAERYWERLGAGVAGAREALLDAGARAGLEAYGGNIENCIGLLKIPVGIAGPLRVNGLHAQGDYPVPLATTEAALVASYHRGACLLSAAGGCAAMLVQESVARAPAFVFSGLAEAGRFVWWVMEHVEALREAAESTTRHGKLIDVTPTLEANHVYLTLEFTTGDAAGQNMVTLAAQAACDWIVAQSPVRPKAVYVEGNLSGDKKASAKAFTTARGKKVTAEAVLPGALLERHVRCGAAAMADYWRLSAVGGVLSGTMGVQGPFANGLAAVYRATGQDAACVAESAVGVTRFEALPDGALYAGVTLPGIMVGTVGGGTGLPSQRACLELMGLAGPGHARALAEVVCGLLLGGELSIIAALAAGHFARAHQKLARGRGASG